MVSVSCSVPNCRLKFMIDLCHVTSNRVEILSYEYENDTSHTATSDNPV